jgi:hypothetical protein
MSIESEQPLWAPSPARVAGSQLARFMQQVNALHDLQLLFRDLPELAT